ncbi:MAG TPA: Nif3-like dinuclear metal center hexameric protein [Tepidisphaeraceae bacterium]|nr:Nif3-like dinuclear metal center hexameric protein [Tepidisphaeraceae bacterium]
MKFLSLSELSATLEKIAPLRFAEDWDNVGLLVGDPSQRVHRAMLTIDYTQAVAEEARSQQCDMIIAYHPPLFNAVKRVTASGGTGLIHDAIRRGVAIYSPHTALDVAEGGTNDVLADGIALANRRPLKLRASTAAHHKLAVFVPRENVEQVAAAIFAAGAGAISGSNYSQCSFRSEGTGTFFGGEGATPAVGAKGQLERVAETRLETVVPISRTAEVVAAMRAAHPYEEVAYDLTLLAGDPTSVGIGRVGTIPGDATADMLVNMLKRATGIDHVLAAGDVTRLVKRAAVCAGACGGDLLSEAIAQGVDLYVTGEMRHHDALRAVQNNVTVICTLHSNSERAALVSLAARINAAHPEFPVVSSRQDRDPFSVR